MTRKINAVDRHSGRLVCVEEQGIFVLCVCTCGNLKRVRRINFLAGYTKSCGCYRNDQIRAAMCTHSMTGTVLYNKWKIMRRRCNDPAHDAFPYYGGKGIKVCERWSDFRAFYIDMSPSYVEGLTLDRISNTGDYEPSNCRWITFDENRRHQGGS